MRRIALIAAAVLLPLGVTACDQGQKDAREFEAASATTAPGANPTTTAPNAPTGRAADFGAFDVCKGFVKERLKAPSTAKFRDFYQDDGEVQVDRNTDGTYTVTSTVDAQNSFGAKLRSTFTCTVHPTGKDTWLLDDISII